MIMKDHICVRISLLDMRIMVSEVAPGSWEFMPLGPSQPLLDEGEDALVEVLAGSGGDVAQRPLAGQHGQPVHGGPDGVLDAVAALPAEHAGVDHFVQGGAELAKR